jgi:hypothetical protein
MGIQTQMRWDRCAVASLATKPALGSHSYDDIKSVERKNNVTDEELT